MFGLPFVGESFEEENLCWCFCLAAQVFAFDGFSEKVGILGGSFRLQSNLRGFLQDYAVPFAACDCHFGFDRMIMTFQGFTGKGQHFDIAGAA